VNSLLEIPTTLPTLDELWGLNGLTAAGFFELIASRLSPEQPQVLTVHAELEGGPALREFSRFLERACRQGVDFFPLEDWAAELLQCPEGIPVAAVRQGRLPGRAGTVSCQEGMGWRL